MSSVKLDSTGLETPMIKIGESHLTSSDEGKLIWNDEIIEKPDLSGYVTDSELNGKNYLTSSALTDYAKKTDLSSYATTSSLSSYIKTSTLKSYITTTWQSGTSWYRKYSDGWIEQGGYVITNENSEQTINLHTAFSNTDYFLTKQLGFNGYNAGNISGNFYSVWGLTTSSFKTYGYISAGVNAFRWYACGY